MLPKNPVSARAANKTSSMDHGLNEKEEDKYARTKALPRAIERGTCATGNGDETRERRQKQIFYV